jgi:hypothetical protein
VQHVRPFALILIPLVIGCSSSPPVQAVSPSGGPTMVAAAFMQAVADSNLSQMGALWGTERGPASATNNPSNWRQRVTVMQAYLQGGTARVLSESEAAMSQTNRREVIVELKRSGCTNTVPLTMVRTRDGAWLVNAIDLTAAGVPGRSCNNSSAGTPPPPPAFIR